MSNGAEVVADALMDSLLVGESFAIPSVNLNDPAFNFPSIVGNPMYAQVTELSNEDLTTRTIGGTGTYDAIMQSQAVHLKEEFTAGRITGADYAKAYVALAQSASGQAVQFLLGKDQAYWASVIAQGQALTARVQLETAKAQLAIALIEANNQRATFALNKIRLANEDAQYGITKYNLATTLPAQTAQITAQTANITAEGFNIPKQGLQLDAQTALVTQQRLNVIDELLTATAQRAKIAADTAQTTQQTTNLVAEALNIPKQGSLIDAQALHTGKQADIATQEILVKQQQVLVATEEVLVKKQQVLLATKEIEVAAAKLVNIPKEGAMLDAQKLGVEKNTEIASYNLTTKLPADVAMLDEQRLGVVKSTEIASYNLSSLMPAQLTLIKEQGEVQRAQTLDIRLDGIPVNGSIKSQKDLYAQQIISYQRSSQTNAAKVWVDSWVADSALQDSPKTPTGFTETNIGAVLTTLKTTNGL